MLRGIDLRDAILVLRDAIFSMDGRKSHKLFSSRCTLGVPLLRLLFPSFPSSFN